MTDKKELNMEEITFSSGKDGTFKFDRELTVVEVLGIAIRSEVSSYALYNQLSKRVENKMVKNRLVWLGDEEKNHRIILTDMYGDLTGEKYPAIPPTGNLRQFVDVPIEDMANLDVLKLAARKEELASKFYSAAIATLVDPKAKEMLEYLSEMETGHQDVLLQEIKHLEKNPLWHEQQAGQLFHVGP